MAQARDSEQLSRQPAVVEMIVFAVALGAVTALLKGYSFGGGDQVEQLPLVMRILDPSFAPLDPFVNGAALFSPRVYYCHLLAALAHLMPLWLIGLLGTVLCNAAVALITYYASRDLLGASHLAGIVACVMVMSLHSIAPGGSGQLYYEIMVPSTLAKPLLLLSLWAALRLRPVASAGLALAASLMHPLLGIITGFMALTSTGLILALGIGREGRDGRFPWRALGVTTLAAFGLAVGAWVLWLSNYHTSLSATQFIDILARFRCPHHYLPGTFPRSALLACGAFLLALVISWRWHRADPRGDRGAGDRLLIPVALTVLLMIGGWVFVEIIPTRLFTSAQAFRFVFIPKWIGMMLFAATMARLWRSREAGQSVVGWLMFLAHGPMHGAVILGAHLVEVVRGMLHKRWRGRATLPWLVLGVAVAILPMVRWPMPVELATLVLLGLAGLAQVMSYSRAVRIGASVIVLGLVCALTHPVPITMTETNRDIAAVSEFAREHTPEDAFFVVPPNMGAFRVMARRALLVNFKTFPFDDREMVSWRERIEDCYGPVSSAGIGAAFEMDETYKRIEDERLRHLGAVYGVDHAVLYVETATRLPVVYVDDVYRIVRIPAS